MILQTGNKKKNVKNWKKNAESAGLIYGLFVLKIIFFVAETKRYYNPRVSCNKTLHGTENKPNAFNENTVQKTFSSLFIKCTSSSSVKLEYD